MLGNKITWYTGDAAKATVSPTTGITTLVKEIATDTVNITATFDRL